MLRHLIPLKILSGKEPQVTVLGFVLLGERMDVISKHLIVSKHDVTSCVPTIRAERPITLSTLINLVEGGIGGFACSGGETFNDPVGKGNDAGEVLCFEVWGSV